MKLSRFRLTNFQDHYSTEVNFSPTFNCIIGPTNSGKSSLARALTFLFYGDWIDDYISHGTTQTTIEATFDNGVTITRIKGGGENAVKLKKGTEEHVFEKINRTLPTEFYHFLQLSPIQLDVDQELYLNIANQDDPYFLLTEKGPIKTKVLGKLAGLHIADAAIRGLNTDKKSLSSEKQHLLNQLETSEQQLQQYQALPAYQQAAQLLQQQITSTLQVEQRLGQLKQLRSTLTNWETQVTRLRQFQTKIIIPNLLPIQEGSQQLQILKEKENLLRKYTFQSSQLQSFKKELSNQLISEKEELKRYLQLQQCCPTCNTPFTPKTISAMVERA